MKGKLIVTPNLSYATESESHEDDYEYYERLFDPTLTDRRARRKRKPKVRHIAKKAEDEIVAELGELAGLEAGFQTTYHPGRYEEGWLLDSLRGFYDEALIVMTSDHGEEFWDHGRTEHGHTVYDELLRVPLMVKLPAIAARDRRSWLSRLWTGIFGMDDSAKFIHGVIDEAVTNRGIMPMILDACGIEGYDKELSSKSLSPYFGLGPKPAGPPPALFASGPKYGKFREAVVFDGWKYMTVPATGEQKLFNLKTDPGEQTRLESSRPDMVERAKKLLKAHAEASKAVKSRMIVKDGNEFVIDDETKKELEALGYVEE